MAKSQAELDWMIKQVEETLGERERAVERAERNYRLRAEALVRAEDLAKALLKDAGNAALSDWYEAEIARLKKIRNDE